MEMLVVTVISEVSTIYHITVKHYLQNDDDRGLI